MPEQRICSFTNEEIEPGTGMMYVKRDGSVYWFRGQQVQEEHAQAQEEREEAQMDSALREGRNKVTS